MDSLNKFQPYMLALLRIIAGYMFLLHGTAKFFEFPISMAGGNGAVEFFSLYGIGGLIEITGGILIILGLFTRPAAFMLSGQMAYAYFFIHASVENVLLPVVNQGELAALYALVFCYFVVSGAGAFAFDNRHNKG
ncbi:DoxX family protein [Pasteurella oralis]|uniref:DoxX family protein n=1 Tax=Pasteurella oralis TaxID=1071947 RepID=A0ABW4NS98_9PAST